MIKKDPILIFSIFFVGLILFYPTFDLGVFGDNWMVFWNGMVSYGNTHQWGALTTYINPYGSNHLLLYSVARLFGYNPQVLYVLAYIFRFVVSVTLFWFMKKRGFGKFISCAAAVVFMLSPVGIEVYDWVFQIPSYLCLALVLLAIDKLFTLNSYKNTSLFLCYFFLSLSINPIRLHGILILLLPLLLCGVFVAGKERKKFYLIALVLSLLIFFVLLQNLAFGDPINAKRMMTPGVAVVLQELSSGNFISIYRLILGVVNGFLPSGIVKGFNSIAISEKIFGIYRPSFEAVMAGFAVYLLVRAASLPRKIKQINMIHLVAGFVPIAIFIFVLNKGLIGVLPVSERLSVVVGVSFLSSLLVALVHAAISGNRRIADYYLLFVLSFSFLVLPMLHNPVSVFNVEHRYLVFNALVMPIILALGLSSKNLIVKIIFLIILISISVAYYQTTSKAVENMLYRHGRAYSDTIWNQIDAEIPDYDPSERAVFYFEADEPERAHESIFFGFSFRMGLKYGISDFNKLPFVVGKLEDFESATTDGQSTLLYIGEKKVFTDKEAFRFRIKGNKVERLKT